MKITTHSSVPVYTICGSTARPLPEWLVRKRRRSSKWDPETTNRVQLLQDFEFEEASNCVRISEDGNWVVSTGTYKPQMHIHNLSQLSLSYARITPALNVKFELLSSDYSKSLHLQSDRSLEFHTPMGCHYSTRIPRYGRDLVYDKLSAEALVPSAGVNADGLAEVFRLNLEIGRFMRGYEIEGDGVEVGTIAEDSHNLLAFGTTKTIEFWDSRSKGRVGILSTDVYSMKFDKSGLNLAVGSPEGIVQIFDIRSPAPLLRKDQGYGFPIKNLIFMGDRMLSADKKIIKIWDKQTGEAWTSMEPEVDLNDVAWFEESGMIITANEGREQHAFFVPQLGPAPKWCSFLDNLVEEMDPSQSVSTYDDYKFLTLPELKQLNLGHLVGTTNLLRPYMHGYFVAQRLYEEARLIADPFVWEEERAKRVREKIDKERESRIRSSGSSKKLEKILVNKKLAEKVLAKEEKHKSKEAAGLLQDPRFASLFENEEFAVDEHSMEFKQLNPNTRPTPVATKDRGLTAVEEEEIARQEQASSSSDSEEEQPKRAPQMRISTADYKRRKPKKPVVGEREIKFTPGRAAKPKESQERRGGQKERRSASGNIFRRM